MKILIIDDDALLRRTLARGLSDHDVEMAESCAAGREHILATRFDLVLSDLHLDDGLGTDIHRWMLEEGIDFGSFALMTGSPLRNDERERLASLDCPVLAKPFGKKDIANLLARVT